MRGILQGNYYSASEIIFCFKELEHVNATVLTDTFQLPLDVDEANRDLDILRVAAEADRSVPAFPQTTMSCYVHLLRLRIIDSEIQHKVYRVDCVKSPESIYKMTDILLAKLQAWKDVIPPESTHWDPRDRQTFRGDEYRSYDSYVSSVVV